MTLALSKDVADRTLLERLAGGYGITERVTFEQSQDSGGLPDLRLTMAEIIQNLSEPDDLPAALRVRDEVFAGHRIAVVTNVPAPYRLPLLSRISTRLTRAGAEFRVFFMGTKARGRPWIGHTDESDFDHESLTSLEIPFGVRRPLVPLNLARRLSAFGPTIVLVGSLSPLVTGPAARHARRHGAVFGIWSGEIAGRPTSASRARRVLRKRLVRRADFAIAYGFLAGEYPRSLRVDLPLVYGRNTSDARALERSRPARPETVELIAVADMAKPGKGIKVLVDALRSLPTLRCSLTVVGPGAEASGLMARARGDDRIRFTGALPQAQVRERYAQSDVFLFPSSAEADVFGLALIEAMGSGLASIVSSTPGAIADVGVDGWSCIVARERTPRAWAEAVERVVLDHDLRLSLGENAARTIARRWTIDHASDSMIAGLRLGVLATAR